MTAEWTAARLPRLDGKRFIVTGASNGVGLETSRALADAGAHVILAVRNVELGAQRAAEIGGSTEVGRLDLSTLASVREFAASVVEPVDVLINNAGMFPLSRTDTVDGFESTMGTNFLGPAALTHLLLDRVADRVVNVGSNAHKTGKLDLNDMVLRQGRWTGPRAYAASKLALMLWTLDLERQLREGGSPIRVMASEPGWAATNISNKDGFGPLHKVVKGAATRLANDAVTAARSTLFAATEPLPSGSYAGFDGALTLRGRVTLIARGAAACDYRTAALVREYAETATGAAIDLTPRT